VMFFGKPMGAGLPLGAILARREIMESWNTEGPASTLAGSTLACARSLALIETIERDKILDNVERVGKYMVRRLSEMSREHPLIGDVRGKGLLIAAELVKERETQSPAHDEAQEIVEEAYRKGLIIIASGRSGNILKFSPPLILTEEQARSALDTIEDCLKRVGNSN